MNVHDLTELELLDNGAFFALVSRAGVTAAQARLFLAALADLPAQQVVRMTTSARADRLRQINRTTRRSENRKQEEP